MLEIKDLKVSVNNKEILKGLNLNVGKGEILVIMGPNGAGKSTLANAILSNSDYSIDRGKIIFNGVDITNKTTDEIARSGIFLSFQNPVEIEGLSVMNLIRVAKSKITGENVSSFEIRDELYDNMRNLAVDEEYASRSTNVGFSGGEKKKNEILQMLMLKPKLAILDEIDSGLDVDAIKLVAKGIKTYKNKDNSIIIITHSTKLLDELDNFNVAVINDGKIIRKGDKSLAYLIEREGFINED